MHSLEGNDSSTLSRASFRDFLLVPLGCLIRSPLLLLVLVIAVGLFGWVSYTNFNWDVLGMAAPKFHNWDIAPGFKRVTLPTGEFWEITYEGKTNSAFAGLIRHITPIREVGYPLLTHDILVTSGGYADPEIVRTSVSNHRFSWSAQGVESLSGSINLLHAVPQNEQIYRTLLSLRKGDWVKISGREILSIDHFNTRGTLTSTWTDAGCNSILVMKVEPIEPPVE
jgi:hypothetical protein